jgi:hypothetical protein
MRATLTALLLLGVATASHAEAVLQQTFDDGAGEWQAFTADTATAPLTTETQGAHQGGALVCRYNLKNGGFYGFGTMIGQPLVGAHSLRLWLKTNQESILAIAIQEADESRYMSMLHTEANVWQDVQVSLQRFRLSDDTTDENGKLDLNQVAAIGMVDLAGFLGPLVGAGADAPRELWLDDFSVDTEDAANRYTPDGHLPYMLDSFEAGYLNWFSMMGKVTRDEQAGSLVWTYPGQQPEGRFCALLGFVGPLPKSGATHILLTLKSQHAVTLAIVLQEEKRGVDQDESRYATTLEVPASDTATTFAVPLDDLQLDTNNNGSDENGHLDLDQVSSIIIGDLGVIGGGTPDGNTLQIDEIELIGAG